MTEDELAAKGAAIALLLDGLKPADLDDVLLRGGVFAPAVSTTQYIYRIFDDMGAPKGHLARQFMLNDICVQTITIVSGIICDVGSAHRLPEFKSKYLQR